MKTFFNKQKPKDFIVSGSVLQEILKEADQAEKKYDIYKIYLMKGLYPKYTKDS